MWINILDSGKKPPEQASMISRGIRSGLAWLKLQRAKKPVISLNSGHRNHGGRGGDDIQPPKTVSPRSSEHRTHPPAPFPLRSAIQVQDAKTGSPIQSQGPGQQCHRPLVSSLPASTHSLRISLTSSTSFTAQIAGDLSFLSGQ